MEIIKRNNLLKICKFFSPIFHINCIIEFFSKKQRQYKNIDINRYEIAHEGTSQYKILIFRFKIYLIIHETIFEFE